MASVTNNKFKCCKMKVGLGYQIDRLNLGGGGVSSCKEYVVLLWHGLKYYRLSKR